jgi:hypothetical protein
MGKSLSWAILVALMGCSLPHSYDEVDSPANPEGCDKVLHVSPDFTPEDFQAFLKANAEWNKVTKRSVCLDVAESDTMEVRRISPSSEEYLYWRDRQKTDFWGMHVWYGSDEEILIVDTLSTYEVYLTFKHELGHSHGLGHITSCGVMNTSGCTTIEISEADIDECRRVQACE